MYMRGRAVDGSVQVEPPENLTHDIVEVSGEFYLILVFRRDINMLDTQLFVQHSPFPLPRGNIPLFSALTFLVVRRASPPDPP